jgi:hypothetical protein
MIRKKEAGTMVNVFIIKVLRPNDPEGKNKRPEQADSSNDDQPPHRASSEAVIHDAYFVRFIFAPINSKGDCEDIIHKEECDHLESSIHFFFWRRRDHH